MISFMFVIRQLPILGLYIGIFQKKFALALQRRLNFQTFLFEKIQSWISRVFDKQKSSFSQGFTERNLTCTHNPDIFVFLVWISQEKSVK